MQGVIYMDQGKIGSFISDLRKEKKLTQAELGDIVGVTGKAVSRWERGLNLPDRAIMNKVSEALGVSTTELLNGERVVDLSKENLDQITENSVAYYKEKLRKKFKKVFLSTISIIVLITLALFMTFYFNNAGSCNVYDISSESTELFAEGMITQTNDKTTLVISNFLYKGTNIRNVYAIDYDVVLDGKVIANGGYNLDEINYMDDEFDIQKFFNVITIYLETDKKYDFDNIEYLSINFRYTISEGEDCNFKLPLKVEKKFSNNKFIYSR